jgi:hypothetical protein
MADYGISFSSCANDSLESFITFPLDDDDPDALSPTAFTNSNWGPQGASAPSPKNLHKVTLNETRSIAGHLPGTTISPYGGPLGIYRARARSSIGFLTPFSLQPFFLM